MRCLRSIEKVSRSFEMCWWKGMRGKVDMLTCEKRCRSEDEDIAWQISRSDSVEGKARWVLWVLWVYSSIDVSHQAHPMLSSDAM